MRREAGWRYQKKRDGDAGREGDSKVLSLGRYG